MNSKFIISCFIFCLIGSSHAAAKENKVDVKCHIELLGGEQTIYLAQVKQKQLKNVVNILKNRRIVTNTSNEKKKVYKVLECVLNNEAFKSLQARQLFSNYAL